MNRRLEEAMERLTDEVQIGPFAALRDKAETVPGAFGTYDCFYAHEVAVTRLKQYEDTGLMPGQVLQVARQAKFPPPCYIADPYGGCTYQVYDGDDEPIARCKECPLCYCDKQRHRSEPNAPLTLEELREMDGEPVWVVQSEVDGCWALISAISSAYVHTYRCGVLVIKEYGETWWAYRRKPEEG